MSMRHLLSAGAVALGVLSLATAVFAGPPGHPFDRKLVPAPATPLAPQAQADTCDCMMMKGAAAMREQCMAMMSDHRQQQTPGSAG